MNDAPRPSGLCDDLAVAPGDLSREELIELVRRIMRCETDDEAEEDRLVALFDNSVAHPRASNLIFWPEHELGPDAQRRDLTPEEVVDIALAYKPIELGPAD
jgi:Colicin immunity protein / pyocin immunity protein